MSRIDQRFMLGSFAYRYAVGVKGFAPEIPLDAEGFIKKAAELGYQRVLLCENLNYAVYDDDRIRNINTLASNLGIEIDVGFRGIGNLKRHMEIARMLNAKNLRVVVGENIPTLCPHPEELCQSVAHEIRENLSILEAEGMILGIENNFELPIERLIQLVREINSQYVGLIMDCTNCLGLIENPYYVIQKMSGYIKSVHLKDYVVKKVEAGYRVEGVPLGSGWLNVPRFMTCIEEYAPDASIAVEYGMRRDDNADVIQTVLREQQCNEKDAAYLLERMYLNV